MSKQNRLNKVLNEKNISAYRVAKDCNIALPTMYSIMSGKMFPYPKYRKLISDYLDVPESELFDLD